MNSTEFFLFFSGLYTLYLLCRGDRTRENWILLVGSYVFYGWWDWRFLGLIAGSTLNDFICAQRIHATRRRAKAYLLVSLTANLGALAFFKYFNFFTGSAVELLELLGFAADPITLKIILPVGISFYTFQTLGYTVDVYRGKVEPTTSLPEFALYVAFFPQLVAGPIERASRLLG